MRYWCDTHGSLEASQVREVDGDLLCKVAIYEAPHTRHSAWCYCGRTVAKPTDIIEGDSDRI